MGIKSFFIITLFATLFVSFSDTMKCMVADDDMVSIVQKIENEETETEMEEEYAKLIHYGQHILFGIAPVTIRKNTTLCFKYYLEPHITVTTPPPNFILS